MKNLQGQKGFTLVELAIVLTIIGLLIGGILKGQQLIANARVTAQISQAQAVTAAITSFVDTYQGLPGDLNNATLRIANCTGAGYCGNGLGIGVIGTVNPSTYALQPTGTATQTNAGVIPVVALSDVGDAFTMLANANLISGVNTNSATATSASWGSALPAAKINSASGLVMATGADGYVYITILTKAGAAVAAAAGSNSMTAGQAAQIDRKMDDGAPSTGSVVGQGFITNCGTSATGYVESSTTGNDCGLNIRVQQ